MSARIWKDLGRTVLLLLVQVVLLNSIHLLGYATPFIIAYLPMHAARRTPRIPLLLWAFCTGFLSDVLSNTVGMGMAACTFAAMAQPSLLEVFAPRNADDDMVPSLRAMGTWRYLFYTLCTMLLFHAVFYALDAFTLTNWRLTVAGALAATLAATLLSMLLHLATTRRHE